MMIEISVVTPDGDEHVIRSMDTTRLMSWLTGWARHDVNDFHYEIMTPERVHQEMLPDEG